MSSTERKRIQPARMAVLAATAVLAGCTWRPMGEGPNQASFGAAIDANIAIQTGRLNSRAQLVRLLADFRRNAPGTITFDFASASLDERARDALRRQALWLTSNPGTLVVVEGHGDAVGSDAVNDGIGLRRARRVARALGELGVDPSRVIAVETRGEREPVVPVDAKERRNRRTVTLLGGYAIAGGGPGFDGKRALLGYIEYVRDEAEGVQIDSSSGGGGSEGGVQLPE